MTSHVHLIIGTQGNNMEDILRDFKSFTSRKLRLAMSFRFYSVKVVCFLAAIPCVPLCLALPEIITTLLGSNITSIFSFVLRLKKFITQLDPKLSYPPPDAVDGLSPKRNHEPLGLSCGYAFAPLCPRGSFNKTETMNDSTF